MRNLLKLLHKKRQAICQNLKKQLNFPKNIA